MLKIRKNTVVRESVLEFAKDHAIAWSTFAMIFTIAMSSVTMQKSFDQSARDQLAQPQYSSRSEDYRPLDDSGFDSFLSVTQALQRRELRD